MSTPQSPSGGSLVVVGVGIKLVGHVTLEAQAQIQQAEKLFYLVNNRVITHWLHTLNPTAESLHPFYADDKLRLQSYQEMVAHLLAAVRQGLQVCAVFYGHPGVLVTPAHAAIRQARAAGYRAWMLPGVSAEDCLFADLGFDPADRGWHSLDATSLLLWQKPIDITTHLILWQIGVIGVLQRQGDIQPGLLALTERLVAAYGADHTAVIYEAAEYPTLAPRIDRIQLADLPTRALSRMSTLYVPPKARAQLDQTMLARLGIDPAALRWQRPASAEDHR